MRRGRDLTQLREFKDDRVAGSRTCSQGRRSAGILLCSSIVAGGTVVSLIWVNSTPPCVVL